MAFKALRMRLGVVVVGLLCTFIVTMFLGISMLEDGTSMLNSRTPCVCPNEIRHSHNGQGKENSGTKQAGLADQQIKDQHKSAHTMCVLVPFRDRFEELQEFVPYLSRFLKRQMVSHKIIIINQVDKFRFNRASLINAGFLESRQDCDYMAMHDVDLLPANEDLLYKFPEAGPMHLSAPHLHPIYHYKTFVGGILLLQSKHFEMVNGMSNKYWGWGREDDEFFVRMKKAKLQIDHPGNLTTGYKTFRHIHDKRTRPRDRNNYFNQKEMTKRLDKQTGLNTLSYVVDSIRQLTIDGEPVTVMNTLLECDIDFTPWCLRKEDHGWYQKRLTEKNLQGQTQRNQQ